MKKLFTLLASELDAGRSAVLCSIAASHGSTPRGAGAKMLALEDGRTLGTIGGGAAEYHACRLAGELLTQKRSRFRSYRLSGGEMADTGMICGGGMEVYFQYFDPADRGVLRPVLELLDAPCASWLVTEISGSGWRMGVFDRENGLRGLEAPAERLTPLLGSRAVLEDGTPALYVEPLCQAGTVYLFGGGHVARELSRILTAADFRLAVWDQRPEAAEFFQDAFSFRCGPFAEALEYLPPLTAEDYVVIMTPGHQWDYEVLSQVLRTPARYIGCIGSRKKTAAVRERLLADGFGAAEISRIYAPIGLPIGGDTPAEIAVSVAAQLIACRSGRLEAFPRAGEERRRD